jgi:hypothetical protein
VICILEKKEGNLHQRRPGTSQLFERENEVNFLSTFNDTLWNFNNPEKRRRVFYKFDQGFHTKFCSTQ